MQIEIEKPEETADTKTPRTFTQADCQRIAASYKAARAAGRVRKPMSVFIAKILHTAAVEDR